MKQSEPLVSVVMPTYNCSAYIGEAIQSVLGQTYANFEVLVVDNYSSDNTDEVIRNCSDPRVKYFKFNNNGIIAASRNYAVQRSAGDVLAFLDADDVWLPNKLDVQLPFLNERNLAIIASDYFPLGEVTFYRRDSRLGRMKFRDYSYSDALLANPAMTSSVIMRRSDFIDRGEFNESEEYQFIEDWELWLRVIQKGEAIRVLGSPLIGYRIRRNKHRDRRELSLRALKLVQKHSSSGALPKSVMRAAEGNCFAYVGKAYLDSNDRRGIRYYCQALTSAGDWKTRTKAAGGLLLFLLPFGLRCRTIEALHRFYWALVSHRFKSVAAQQ